MGAGQAGHRFRNAGMIASTPVNGRLAAGDAAGTGIQVKTPRIRRHQLYPTSCAHVQMQSPPPR